MPPKLWIHHLMLIQYLRSVLAFPLETHPVPPTIPQGGRRLILPSPCWGWEQSTSKVNSTALQYSVTCMLVPNLANTNGSLVAPATQPDATTSQPWTKGLLMWATNLPATSTPSVEGAQGVAHIFPVL